MKEWIEDFWYDNRDWMVPVALGVVTILVASRSFKAALARAEAKQAAKSAAQGLPNGMTAYEDKARGVVCYEINGREGIYCVVVPK